MGGCCCCCFPSRRSEPVRTPTYYYCPRTSEEREPLSANHEIPAGGLLVDTNLDTASLDTYTSPPAPLPYDVDIGRPRTPIGRGNHPTKSDTSAEVSNSGSEERLSSADSIENLQKDVKDIDGKTQSVLELTLSGVSDDDLKKGVDLNLTIIEEEDCPICLEEYTEENPKMITNCEHHFHLCCILEWMERSETCPVCDKELAIDDVF